MSTHHGPTHCLDKIRQHEDVAVVYTVGCAHAVREYVPKVLSDDAQLPCPEWNLGQEFITCHVVAEHDQCANREAGWFGPCRLEPLRLP